ncbi:MAG: 50S ribosomal protein L11 methyltransferase [Myxococcaceae bacterium]
MAANYLSLTVDLAEESSELAQSLLHDAGALGLEVRDSEGPPMPGVRGPAAGEAIVIAFFDERQAADEALARLVEAFPAARAKVEEVPSQDWSNAWKALIRSVEIGRLWVGPPWELANAPASKTRIVIEPKMAFGTGDHPTTSLCLAAVDRFLAAHPGASVLDVGTGTGVLAIAARKLGAGRVVGVDNDEMSVTLAKENAEANGVSGLELSGKTLDGVSGTFDLVLGNILANTLVALAPAIAAKVKQRLVLAGVLVPQREEVEAAYRAQGLVPDGHQVQDDWIRLDFKRG